MLPPMWAATGVGVLWALHRWFAGPELLAGWWRGLGLVPLLGGAALALWGERHFARAGTGVVPGSPVTTLVRTGPFRFTRNPMYLGMTLALLGVALLFGTATGLIVPPIFGVVMQWRFIRREECMLRERFGEAAWNDYARSTRRWL